MLIILPLNYIMINKNGGRDRRFIRNISLLVKLSFPTVSSFQRFRIRSVGYDYTSWDMSCVQWLESCGSVHIRTLVPQLNSHLFPIDPKNLEWKVSIGAQTRKLCVLFLLIVGRKVIRKRRHIYRAMVCRLCERVGAGVIVFEYLYYWGFSGLLFADHKNLFWWLH